MTEYVYKTSPRTYQAEDFARTRAWMAFGCLYEPGLGKTKLTIDTAAWLFERGEIDCLLAVSPSGVHWNWTKDEVPAHLPDRVGEVTSVIAWDPKLAHKEAWRATVKQARLTAKFVVASMTYHSLMTQLGDAFAHAFLESRRCILVVDESQRMKQPGTKWTMRLRALGRRARYRRILTGTPATQSPFDFYSQLDFLEPGCFAHLGVRTFSAFKSHFGAFAPVVRGGGRPVTVKSGPFAGQAVLKVVGYRNLGDLRAVVDRLCIRRTKEQCLDLPGKVFQKRYFDMGAKQAAFYETLKEELRAQVAPGSVVTAMLAISMLTRLQQVACGFVGTDDGPCRSLCGPSANPRVDCLLEAIDDRPEGERFIVWCKYDWDVNDVLAAFKRVGISAVRYDGQVDNESREEARRAFQAKEVRAFVGKPSSAGVGLTLTAATCVYWYSSTFKLEERLQGDERAHRIGTTETVTYVDIVARDTVDERVIEALREKRDVIEALTGDKLREWI